MTSGLRAKPGESLIAAPDGLRWATGGGSRIGGCNGLHLAKADTRGTICGKYGPATTSVRRDLLRYGSSTICGSCARIAKVPRDLREWT